MPGVVFQDPTQTKEDTSFQQLSAFLQRRLFNKLLQDKGSNSTHNSAMVQEISEMEENVHAHLNGYLEKTRNSSHDYTTILQYSRKKIKK